MNRAKSVIVLATIAIVLSATIRTLAADCNSCKPGVYDYSYMEGDYDVCFEDQSPDISLTDDEKAAMEQGISEYWGAFFEEHNIPIGFSFSYGNCSTDSIKIKTDFSVTGDDMAVAAMTPDGRGAEIRVNPYVAGGVYGESNFKNLGAHEMGHLLDYRNVDDPNCAPYTIMSVPNHGDWQPTLRCSDRAKMDQIYFSEEEEDWRPSINNEDCWDVWLIQRTYCENLQGWWYLCNYREIFLGTECDDPLEGEGD